MKKLTVVTTLILAACGQPKSPLEAEIVPASAEALCCGSNCCCIGSGSQEPEESNPANACEVCNPGVSLTEWSPKCAEDNLSCTTVGCNAGTCNLTITSGCLIDGVCVGEGETNPNNDCQVCDSATSETEWSDKDSTAACDDGDPCTEGDSCDGSGACVPGAAKDCSSLDTECAVGECNTSGTCVAAPREAGTACGASGSCAPGTASSPAMVTAADRCDGSGNCETGATTECGAYTGCDGSSCASTCSGASDCVDTSVCVDNLCYGAAALGSACVNGAECDSGFCADGVCCSTTCDGVCESCLAASTGGTDGTCASSTAGTDPDGECATEAATTCGTTGSCNGAGACALFDVTTNCAAATCDGDEAVAPRNCDGSGTCMSASTSTCSPFGCDDGACLTSCTTNSECATGARCEGGSCLAGNRAPIASAGPVQTVNPGSVVALSASSSIDPDSDPLTYSWSQTSGPTPVTLDHPDQSLSDFVAPSAVGEYGFRVEVSDGSLSDSDTTTVTIESSSTNSDDDKDDGGCAAVPPGWLTLAVIAFGWLRYKPARGSRLRLG